MSENQENSKLLVRYKNETFDLTHFAHKHPGGTNTLSAAIHSDIEYKFETSMPHSPAAKYLLKEYRVTNKLNNNDQQFNNEMVNDQSENGKFYDHKSNEHDTIEHLIKTDESMEVSYKF